MMNAQLIDAIRQLNLKPGESVSVEVDGHTVEVRLRPAGSDEPSAYEGQVMMMPWFDSPDPTAGTILALPGQMPPTDPVIVPHDGVELT